MAELGKRIEQGGESERQPKRVFVEVGTDVNPIPSIGEKQFGDNDIYIGLDISREKAIRASKMPLESEIQEGVRHPERRKNIFFMAADAKQLPLEDESVDEFYFGNIFSDPKIIPFELGIGSQEAGRRIDGFLQEAKRVLKSTGKIIIKENSVPKDIRFVHGALSRNGFRLSKFTDRGGRNWSQETAPYDKNSLNAQNPPPDSYILEAEKWSPPREQS